MKAATLKLMMRGVKAKPTLALGRTKEQAQMLYDESCKSLGEGESLSLIHISPRGSVSVK